MNNNRKKYFHTYSTDSGASTNQILALVDTVQSHNKDEIGKLMNDFDMEFIALEGIELTGNPGNSSILTPEANVHVVEKGTTHAKKLEANIKRKKPEEKTPIT